jgi:hypothetical protein
VQLTLSSPVPSVQQGTAIWLCIPSASLTQCFRPSYKGCTSYGTTDRDQGCCCPKVHGLQLELVEVGRPFQLIKPLLQASGGRVVVARYSIVPFAAGTGDCGYTYGPYFSRNSVSRKQYPAVSPCCIMGAGAIAKISRVGQNSIYTHRVIRYVWTFPC